MTISTETDQADGSTKKNSFLETKIFDGLENLNTGFTDESIYFFSEKDFKTVLDRAEHFGLGIYTIEPWYNDKPYEVLNHKTYKKKATNPKWYKYAFIEFKKREKDLIYSATYGVSKKLLADKD